MGYASLSRVLTGWTGTVSFDGDAAGEVTPFERESVASFVARLVEACESAGQSGVTVSVSSSGVISLGGNTPDLTLTGNVATRTGFGSGPYTGGGTYTADGAFSGAFVPAYGLRVMSPMLSTTMGASLDEGAGTAGWRASTSAKIMCWGSDATLPDLSYEYDAWSDGRLMGRFSVRSAQRAPLGRQRVAGQVVIQLDVREVA